MTVRDDAWTNGLCALHCREDRCGPNGERCDCPRHREPGGHPEPTTLDQLLYQVTDRSQRIQLPPYATDCGLDLVTAATTVIHEGQTVDIPCGVRVALPGRTFGWITPRSSTWKKWGLMVIPGVIDEGWRGELFTLVYRPPQPRNGDWTVAVPKGTRLAQLIVLPNLLAGLRVTQTDTLPDAERGLSGFGSSGT